MPILTRKLRLIGKVLWVTAIGLKKIGLLNNLRTPVGFDLTIAES